MRLWLTVAVLRGSQFYASVKSAEPSVATGNVLQLANTWEAFRLHDSIMAISVQVQHLVPALSAA